jgi:hypothetical protein
MFSYRDVRSLAPKEGYLCHTESALKSSIVDVQHSGGRKRRQKRGNNVVRSELNIFYSLRNIIKVIKPKTMI